MGLQHLNPDRTLLSRLHRGATYRADTADNGVVVGEFLGVEVPFGRWAILLRHTTGTESVAIGDIITILPAAA